ncbi:MAG: hypothetical protein RL186_1766 [Pseudomonadota bacterium]|jgi:folate-binding protein YgfZ
MTGTHFALTSRGVLRVSGPDATSFLNGLLSQDVTKAGPSEAVYAALLTPQGKYLFDLFVLSPQADVYLLDAPRPADCLKRLGLYRLRSQVTIEDVSGELKVFASLEGEGAFADGYMFADPRLPSLGQRRIAPQSHNWADASGEAHHHAACRALGVPDPSTDLVIEADFALEGLFDELGGIDFHKGCYVGQEMTSRMKRRGKVRQKLCRVELGCAELPFGTPILAGDWEVGQLRTSGGGIGLAMIRFDRVAEAQAKGEPLLAGGHIVAVTPPDWLILPDLNPAP